MSAEAFIITVPARTGPGHAITEEGVAEFVALRTANGGWVSAEDPGYFWKKDYSFHASNPRPIVLIDPEDADAALRLADAIETCGVESHCDPGECGSGGCWAGRVQDALRSLVADRPDEPTGLGAVIEVRNGELYVRDKTTTTTAHWKRARGQEGGARHRYADLDVARVLSEGVPC